jgi:hypothetical protein
MLGVLNPRNTIPATALKEKFNREMGRYTNEQEQLTAEEQRLETEGQLARRKANYFDTAELFCEMALVLCSINLLTRQRLFWLGGIMAAALGLVISATAFWVR